MARVIAITNQKGGVGKTTTAINLAASLAAADAATLLVDCDPQGNASSGLGVNTDGERLNLYHGLRQEATIDQIMLRTPMAGLNLVPASRDLVGVNIELLNEDERESRLSNLLEPVKGRFQFIVIDCPPALDLLNINALVACDGVIVPMLCEYFALEGISQLVQTLKAVGESWNPKIMIEGVLFTQFDERTNLSRQVADNLRKYFGESVYKTVIPRNVRLAEAPSHGLPVILHDPRSRGAEAYVQLAREVVENEHARQSQSVGSGDRIAATQS